MRVLHRRRQGAQPGQREEARRRRGQRGRGLRRRPLEELARGRVARHRAVDHRDHAVRRRQAALQAVLGDHDRGAPVLVQAAQLPDELVSGDRVELGGRLVEHEQRRVVHHRRRDRHALQLAAREGVGAAIQEVRHPEPQRRLLHRPRHRAARLAAMLQRQLELGPDSAHHDLRLGLLEDRAAHRRELPRPVVAHVEPADGQRTRGLATVEVRHETAEGAQERRLPRARHAGQHREGPGLDRQIDVGQRRRLRLGIAVAKARRDHQRLTHAPPPCAPPARRTATGRPARAAR